MDFITEIAADRFDSKRPMADRIIGKYIATDIIGRGGYSIVYKGMHQALKLPVEGLCQRSRPGDIRVPKRPSEILRQWIKRSFVFQQIKALTVYNKQPTSLSVTPMTGNPRSTF